MLTARWTTPDPAASPWTNLNAYVRNPIQQRDPTGLASQKQSEAWRALGKAIGVSDIEIFVGQQKCLDAYFTAMNAYQRNISEGISRETPEEQQAWKAHLTTLYQECVARYGRSVEVVSNGPHDEPNEIGQARGAARQHTGRSALEHRRGKTLKDTVDGGRGCIKRMVILAGR